MDFTLDTFASECRKILTADPSPVGRGKVRDLVQEVLKDEKFLTTYLNENTPDRQVLYEDPELGFCICAHLNRDAREANPHDHGSSWAIYGQAFGETEMSDWEIVEAAAEGQPAQRARARQLIDPDVGLGAAVDFNGDLPAIGREARVAERRGREF